MNHRIKALPIVVLSLALQVLPLCRQLFVAPTMAGSPLAIIFRWSAAAIALLGANHAVSGATIDTFVNSSNTAAAPVGGKFNYTITMNPAGYAAYSFSATGLPTNIALVANRLTNSTPTVSTPVGTYQIIITAWEGYLLDGGSVPFLLTLSVGNTPAITTQPANQTVIVGTNVNFSVATSGTGPFGFQWRKDGVNIPGETNQNLSLLSVQTSDAATYRVLVTTPFGTTNSLNSRGILTVLEPPRIDLDPFDQEAAPGSSPQFSVTAVGTAPLKYQWRFKGTNIIGGTNSLLQLNNVQSNNSGPYACVVTNSAGSVTSSPAILTVSGKPIISSQPQSFTGVLGDAAALIVTVTTPPLGYQWYFNNTLRPGETEDRIFLNPLGSNHVGQYFVVISNIYGSTTSDVATVTVLAPPKILTHPTNTTGAPGGVASFVATANGTAPLTYYWARNGSNIAVGNSGTLILSNLSAAHAGTYAVTVSNEVGEATSSNATLTVSSGSGPSIAVPPGNLTVIEGAPASFVVSATGAAPMSYQWLKNGSPVSGQTASNLSFAAVKTNDTGNYAVVVTNLSGAVTSTPSAALTVVGWPLLVLSNAPSNRVALRLNQFPSATYAVDFRNSLAVTNWQLLSNLPSVAAASNVLLSAPLTNGAQYYRIRLSIP